MEAIINKLIENKEDLIKNYTKINPETSDYYAGYYSGKIEELKECISELKMILQHLEANNSLI